MQELDVNLAKRSYTIKIAPGLLGDISSLLSAVSSPEKIMLVSNPTVFQLYGNRVVKALENNQLTVRIALIPDGEKYKNMQEALDVLDKGLSFGLERGSAIIALGGGVVGDLAGFVAAIYQRGISFVQIPTTLLAQVDSSVGGKVGVNHSRGKNLVGAFHQPRLVVIDIDTLKTLNDREYCSGLAEVFKYGIVYDMAFFYYLREHLEKIIRRDQECLLHIIYHSCRIKSSIVAEDEREEGIRAVLNLGHTFGHAIEQLTSYNIYRHGEAVAIGTRAATYLALDEGLVKEREAVEILQLYKKIGIPILFPDLDPDKVYDAMLADKKVVKGELRLVLPRGIGGFVISEGMRKEKIINAINKAKKSL
ncbi:MAG: 3-dehydroquinate synthase [Syntrophomonadaceae bacterium]|jgi:3-dehydroquinate synthase